MFDERSCAPRGSYRYAGFTVVLLCLTLCTGTGFAAEPAMDLYAGWGYTPDRGASLRAGVRDLQATFGPEYPRAEEFVHELDRLERRMRRRPSEKDMREFARLQRAALTANPLISRPSWLYVVRPQYWDNHCPVNTSFETGEILEPFFRGGGSLKTLCFDVKGNVTETQTLLELPQGIVRDPDLHYDGKRIVFAMRRDAADDYHIYEMDLASGRMVQLTFGPMVNDLEPIYLPDDRILFNSLRDLKYCQCNRHPMGNLFVMDPDGANMVQLGGNTLWEGLPAMLPDGNILYSRWEYVDRQFGPSFGLWTCNPDGTNHQLYMGNNAWAPGSIFNARPVPGSGLILCVYGSCHDLAWGAMALVDRRLGMDGSAPVLRLWPEWTRRFLEAQDDASMLAGWGGIDLFAQTHPKYEDPYPLSDRHFLVSRTLTEDTGRSMRMGIFYVDIFGNEVLLHTEGEGCYDPMPIRARTRPPVMPSRVDYTRDEGTFYVHDVYVGSSMEQVSRGSIKWLRIVQAPEKRAWSPQGGGGIDADQAPLMNYNLTNNKRILGDVPVAPDGSAYFTVPAGRFVFFQALDENKQMVQSMRSGTFLQPGEHQGCVGCHDPRMGASPAPGPSKSTPLHTLQTWYGQPRDFNYLTEVQPVFDRHCVSCHDYEKDAGKALNLAGDINVLFNTSYLELHRRSATTWYPDPPDVPKLLIKAVHDGPPAVLPPFAWGSHRSRLVDVLRDGHQDIRLSTEEQERIITWIDLNAPYYASYYTVVPDNPWGRSPLDTAAIQRVAALAGCKLEDLKHRPELQISFSRPELSPILAAIGTPDAAPYTEALALIRSGAAVLTQTPREDQLGADAPPRSTADVERDHRWRQWAEEERLSRQAVAEGRKFFRDADARQAVLSHPATTFIARETLDRGR